MIVAEYQGNVLNTTCQTITATVNTVGVMGKGIALTVKQRYPEVEESYKRHLQEGTLGIGRSQLVPTNDGHLVLMFATKQHWRNDSRLEWIELGLKNLIQESSFGELSPISSIVIPPLGCGNGGLDYWTQVRPLIDRYLDPWWADVTLCLP